VERFMDFDLSHGRIYFMPESHLFDKGGNRSMSLENDIMSGSDTENTAEYESDGA
jgi:hypothetical protein